MESNISVRNSLDWEAQVKQEADEIWERILDDDIQKFSWDNFSFNYRAEHNALVLSIGMEMGKKLKADIDVLKASIILHDIGRSVVKKGHGEEGAQMAGKILEQTSFPWEKINEVKYAISVHVGCEESIPETLEACILWDADKLSKLGAAGILQKSMVLPFKGKNSWDAVAEFNELLKTAEIIKNNMKTRLGSEMAKDRYDTLKAFVVALNKEMS